MQAIDGQRANASAPATQLDSKLEAAQLERINELTEQLSKVKAELGELTLEKGRVVNFNKVYSQLLVKVLSTVKPVLNHSLELARCNNSDKSTQLQKELQAAMLVAQTIEGSRKQLEDAINENEESPFVNSIDNHYKNLEENKSILLNLYEKHLKPTGVYPIKDIISLLETWRKNFAEVQERSKESKIAIISYVQNLRRFIDFLEANPIPTSYNATIAQFLAMQNEDMIACLQFDVCNIEEGVKTGSEKVKEQIDKNAGVIKELKVRHDKMLKQYIETESLLQKIELRLLKLSHYVIVQPSMLNLKEDAAQFQRRLMELKNLLETRQGSLFSYVKQVLSFIIEYNGRNPLKDDTFPDKKFEGKIQTIESKWKGEDLKFQEDAEYCSYKEGKAPLPAKGLFDRALEMKQTAEEEIARLIDLVEDYETNKMLKGIFNQMKFYDEPEEAKVKKQEGADFKTELNDIGDLLVHFRAGWQQTAILFAKTMHDTLNFVCSSVMTNDGAIRSGTGYALKGLYSGNTLYVLTPFKE